MAILEGVAMWASITTPNTKFTPVYSINLVVDGSVADTFSSRGFKVKDTEEGPTLVIQRKVTSKDGSLNSPPVLVDRQKNPLDVNVGNGSEVRVHYKEWESTWNGNVFKGLDLCGVQVVKLVEYTGGDGSEFDIIDGEDGSEF